MNYSHHARRIVERHPFTATALSLATSALVFQFL
jgi:hypothetical protein